MNIKCAIIFPGELNFIFVECSSNFSLFPYFLHNLLNSTIHNRCLMDTNFQGRPIVCLSVTFLVFLLQPTDATQWHSRLIGHFLFPALFCWSFVSGCLILMKPVCEQHDGEGHLYFTANEMRKCIGLLLNQTPVVNVGVQLFARRKSTETLTSWACAFKSSPIKLIAF